LLFPFYHSHGKLLPYHPPKSIYTILLLPFVNPPFLNFVPLLYHKPFDLSSVFDKFLKKFFLFF
jgi:hypothetical protein